MTEIDNLKLDGAWWQSLSLDQWSQLAQIVGIIGIVLAIVSLIFQIRANTRAVRLSAMNSTLATYNDIRLAVMTSAELADVAVAGFKDRAALGETDKFKFENYLECLFYSGHAHFTRTQLVNPNTGLWSASAAWYRWLVQENPGVASWWCENKEHFNNLFVAEIEADWHSGCD
jgi:hypothetical protein